MRGFPRWRLHFSVPGVFGYHFPRNVLPGIVGNSKFPIFGYKFATYMKYFVVDAFAQEPFGGNPAGVVLLGGNVQFPEDSLMVKIAAELRYSETAFVQQNGPAEFTVRYFTPAAEVDLCGHATIATFSVLRDEGIVPSGTICCNHTLAGDLEVIVGEQIMMQMAPPQVVGAVEDIATLHKIMNSRIQIQSAAVQQKNGKQLPAEIISTGLPDIIYPVASTKELDDLAPDMEALTALSRELNVVGVHAFTLSDDGYTAHVRNFAPLYDIPEESATGTANAALTYYLFRHGIIPEGAHCRYLQGEAMDRPSVVSTEMRTNGQVYVGGNSYILARGELNL